MLGMDAEDKGRSLVEGERKVHALFEQGKAP